MGNPMRTSGPVESSRASSEELSSYYLGLEGLLNRVERSNTHYEVLGLPRSASSDQVKSAYRTAISEITPPASWVATGIPDQVQRRISKAMDRITQALAVLSNFGKRVDYDNSLTRKVNKPLPLPIAIPEFPKSRKSASEEFRGPSPEAQSVVARPEVARAYGVSESDTDERRRCERFKLRIPARITSYDPGGAKWTEVAETVDVARMGVGVRIRRGVRHGTIVHLMVPMPLKLRTHGYSDPGYSVFALVRRVEPQEDGTRIIGLEFLGEHPPAGYLEKPWAVFRTRQWTGSDRRRDQREPRAETLVFSGRRLQLADGKARGYKAAPYHLTGDGNEWSLTVHLVSSKEGLTVWDGRIIGHAISGTMVRTPDAATDLVYSRFTGSKTSPDHSRACCP